MKAAADSINSDTARQTGSKAAPQALLFAPETRHGGETMAAHGSRKVVLAAMIGNGLIAITKFGAAAYTGSSAMLSEAIHSVVDTTNQVLLLHGLKRSTKAADAKHPFGYGREIYFYAFVVAVMIFGVGAGVSLYEGIEKVRHPHAATDIFINYIVLGLALIFETYAWVIAFREFRKSKGSLGWFEAVRLSKDPAVFTVLFEDTAAVLGLLTAGIGIYLADTLQMPVLDGVASIVIGLILAATAAFLAYECKGLLTGEASLPEVVDSIRELAAAEAHIESVNELLTMHMGPSDVLLTMSVDVSNNLPAGEVERLVSRLEGAIKERHDDITRIFIEVQEGVEAQGLGGEGGEPA
jgi:cation diffusion facilitator family transporter